MSPKKREHFDSDQQWWAYGQATRIMRRSELIEFTGWTFDELDRQPREEVDRLETYLRIKAGVSHQRDALERAKQQH